MKIKALGSSSSGNSYLLIGQNETLMLECGVRMSDVKKALNFNISQVVGCLVSHEHGDHSKYSLDVLKCGIPLYASSGTVEMIKTGGYYPNVIMPGKTYHIGEFKILAFNSEHDAKEPLCFYIQHPECGTILFATDTRIVNTVMKGINTFIIEANYSQEEMDKRLYEGSLNSAQARRTQESHMSIEECISTLSNFDLSQTARIILIHLSSGNSNASEFQKIVESSTGKQTFIADKGFEIEINKTPF